MMETIVIGIVRRRVTKMNLTELKNVGCFLDVETGYTYPMLESGKADLNIDVRVHLYDCSNEWFDNLCSKHLECFRGCKCSDKRSVLGVLTLDERKFLLV